MFDLKHVHFEIMVSYPHDDVIWKHESKSRQTAVEERGVQWFG